MKTPQKVKLIAAVTYQVSAQLQSAETFLTGQFGPIDFRTPEFDFNFTDYYREEMGDNLKKIFFGFEKLIPRETLADIKLSTTKYETDTSMNGKRTVNIDPGYIGEANIILASTKNFSHRIYLEKGIYGDCNLILKDGEYHPLPWTYPDYKEQWIREFLFEVRSRHVNQLQDSGSGEHMESVTYRDAGVDIDKGDEVVERIKSLVKKTYGINVLSELGKFGGFFAPDLTGYEQPVLVSSVDGVGTKLMVAVAAGRHKSIGSDLVNHCINDILCCGAKPLFFLDYLAFGKLEPSIIEDVVTGLAEACEKADCALIGGETAEMPGLYSEGDYDISGTIVGIVDRKNILDGGRIAEDDVIIGLPSTGLHTNGFSLARKVLFEKAGLNVDSTIPGLNVSAGEELLKVHKCYYPEVYELVERGLVHGIAHITGGGILGNIGRLLTSGLKADIDWNSWDWLPIFKTIQMYGNIPDDEMKRVFNLGIGLAVIADEKKVDEIRSVLNEKNLKTTVIGKISEDGD